MKGTRDTKTTPPVTGTPDRAASQSGPMIAHLAALAAVVGIPVHLYWALGGTWGYPGGSATAGLPEPVLRDLAAKAGFAQVRHVEMDNPFNSLYELTR